MKTTTPITTAITRTPIITDPNTAKCANGNIH